MPNQASLQNKSYVGESPKSYVDKWGTCGDDLGWRELETRVGAGRTQLKGVALGLFIDEKDMKGLFSRAGIFTKTAIH